MVTTRASAPPEDTETSRYPRRERKAPARAPSPPPPPAPSKPKTSRQKQPKKAPPKPRAQPTKRTANAQQPKKPAKKAKTATARKEQRPSTPDAAPALAAPDAASSGVRTRRMAAPTPAGADVLPPSEAMEEDTPAVDSFPGASPPSNQPTPPPATATPAADQQLTHEAPPVPAPTPTPAAAIPIPDATPAAVQAPVAPQLVQQEAPPAPAPAAPTPAPAHHLSAAPTLPTAPDLVVSACRALCNDALPSIEKLALKDNLSAGVKNLSCCTMLSTIRALYENHTTGNDFFKTIYCVTIDDVIKMDACVFQWRMHAADRGVDSARFLVLEYAKNNGVNLSLLKDGEEAFKEGACCEVEIDAVIAAAESLLGPDRAAEAAALGMYVRKLDADCKRLGANAAALSEEEVGRRLALATTARLFILSLAVVVGCVPPKLLKYWIDPKYYEMAWKIADRAARPVDVNGPPTHLQCLMRNLLPLDTRKRLVRETSGLPDYSLVKFVTE